MALDPSRQAAGKGDDSTVPGTGLVSTRRSGSVLVKVGLRFFGCYQIGGEMIPDKDQIRLPMSLCSC